MPNYAKLIKDVMSKKRKLQDYETVKLTEECSVILQNKLPQKLKDPGSFTIPCFIGDSQCSGALCDLGASINMMLFSIYRELEFGEVKPTTITLQLADRNLTYPRGIVEDVPDYDTPLIFGRPFLATGRALIDVHKGELTLRVGSRGLLESCFVGAAGTANEDDWERRLNPAMEEVVKNEVLKLLNAGVIYVISDSSCVSHMQVVRKNGGITVVRNENDELISNRYNQIAIASEDQEKTTFTCPYGTFAFRRMLFGLCNALATFQRCMMAIFTDMVKDKKGSENQVADHLLRLELEEKKEERAIREAFPDEHLFEVKSVLPWFADIANFLSCGTLPLDLSHHHKKNFFHDIKFFLWDDPFVYKRCADQVIRRCVDGVEAREILEQYHSSSYGVHIRASRTAAKLNEMEELCNYVYENANIYKEQTRE
ncbi:uncharacterized protein LOC142508672 [Primulina tabacum]|uniref:uncharacterized protein LOC142508672 n=1 Tax=Primulina tabacum TaxID=48773 RepID=UPI003F592C3A